MSQCFLQTPLGTLWLATNDEGVLRCEFTENTRHPGRPITDDVQTPTSERYLAKLQSELSAYFDDASVTFTVPLAPLGTPFQQAAWQQLCEIPAGQTRSYAEQARAIGNPAAVRAVARANGANLRCIVIPCHRVIGSDGSLTGFGAGIERKRWLLDHERTLVSAELFVA